MSLYDTVHDLVTQLASNLAGTSLADRAAADVKAIEDLAAQHASQLEQDVLSWLSDRLHPSVAPSMGYEPPAEAPADPPIGLA